MSMTPEKLFNHLKIYVISGDEDINGERCRMQREQFEKIGLPKDIVTFFKAYKPETVAFGDENEYNSYEELKFSPKTLQCCLKSHYEVIKLFGKECENDSTKLTEKKKYAIIMEDDVLLLQNIHLLKDKISETINMWNEANVISSQQNDYEVDFINLSYHQGWISGIHFVENFKNLKNIRGKNNFSLNWGFRETNFSLWGMQCYLIDDSFCKKFEVLFNLRNEDGSEQTIVDLWERHKKIHKNKKNNTFSCKILTATPDSTLPLFFNQGFVYPMLGIEKIFDGCISENHAPIRERQYFDYLKTIETEGFSGSSEEGFVYWSP